MIFPTPEDAGHMAEHLRYNYPNEEHEAFQLSPVPAILAPEGDCSFQSLLELCEKYAFVVNVSVDRVTRRLKCNIVITDIVFSDF